MSLVLAAALFGCEKPSDTAALHDEAIAISHYYKPVVEELNKRGTDIVNRGGKLPQMAGNDVASRQIQMAGQQLAELRGLVLPGADGKSQMEKQADSFAKDGKTGELQRLIDESSEKLEVGSRVVVTELNTAESWLQNSERAHALVAAAPAAPVVPVTDETTGAVPPAPAAPAAPVR